MFSVTLILISGADHQLGQVSGFLESCNSNDIKQHFCHVPLVCALTSIISSLRLLQESLEAIHIFPCGLF